MEDRQIVIGGFYRHFKDKLYQVRCIAYHSETKEKWLCIRRCTAIMRYM